MSKAKTLRNSVPELANSTPKSNPKTKPGYALYYTLKNDSAKKMTKPQTSSLTKHLEQLKDLTSKKAVILLIEEHARITGESKSNASNYIIPYEGEQKDEGVVFDISKFPDDLKWVLWKFVNQQSTTPTPAPGQPTTLPRK